MAVEFEYWEEEMMKKIREKVKKILTDSKACVDLPDDLKEYVVKACENCLGQRSKADPSEVQNCLSQAVKLAEKRLKDILKQQLEQCLKDVLKDLSKACSGYEDEAR